MREVKTCGRCRHFKRRCDLVKPSCTRCLQAGVQCSFSVSGTISASSAAHCSYAPPTSHASLLALFETGSVSSYVSTPPGMPLQSTGASVTATDHGHSLRLVSGATLTGDAFAADENSSQLPLFLYNDDADADADDEEGANGLMSPRESAESPDPDQPANVAGDAPFPNPAASTWLPQESQRIVRKRKRNCLSCLRCRRLKVKCDKEFPCGRCKSSGSDRECYYSCNKGPNGGKFACPAAPAGGPTQPDRKSPQSGTWHITHRVLGSSHWRDLMAKIGSLTPIGQSSLASILEGVATNACLANFSLPANFPFGTPASSKYSARDAITRLIASERDRVDEYIACYRDMLEVVNPVLDIPSFRDELTRYWQDPQCVGLCWLAQFLMVLGLGCVTAGGDPPIAIEFMMAAEASITQTPFMFRPTLNTVRAMTLMVVAKQVCNATCWAMDSSYTLLGLLVRLALYYGLPQDRNEDDGQALDPVEREARRKLWLTILYLDIKVSMCTGMPPLTRPGELGGLYRMAQWGAPENFQAVLAQALPIVLSVLIQMNSKQEPMSYPDVLRYSVQLRELVGHARRVCQAPLQRITVDMFLRRCLMVMHRPFALHAEGPSLFPESCWSSLECSLALLFNYRELWWCSDTAQRYDLVGRPFVLDIFSATLTTCVHMLRQDAPLSGVAASGCLIPPRQLILETLVNCVDIWEGEQEKSVCWRTGYQILRALMAILNAPESEAHSVRMGQVC
ncbi:hypothetical protein EsDP_00005310 [Epichloe bromicola]|uniref:Zn(2)-C6 fungal-type domain-containing protein n=1 Tax=Epichloe bromicola TaxID=79588 RepID=A0ABQ0CUA3_9HYPO